MQIIRLLVYSVSFIFLTFDLSFAGLLRDSGTILPGVYAGDAAWGDYNNDNFPDLVLTGEIFQGNKLERITYVYENSNGSLAQYQRLEGVYFGSVAWGDYDNDGDLDLVVSGINNKNENVLILYKNTNGNFIIDTDQIYLVPVRYSSVAWGDYNRDGYIDLVVTGMNVLGEASTIIYKNVHQGLRYVLTPDPLQVLPNVDKGMARWGDYDNDADLDLALSGFNSSGVRVAKVFKNDGEGLFSEDKSNSNIIKKLSSAFLAWGDQDNNGYLDLLQTGWADGWIPQSSLLENGIDGNLRDDVFAERLNFPLSLVGPAAWGDYDNDGDMDIAIMGQNEFSEIKGYLLKNISYENFQIDNTQTEFQPLRNGALAWADYDNDGDLDLLAMGETAAGTRVTKIYRNEGSRANPPISHEEVSNVFITNNSVSFYWEAGTDTETPQNVLTYNLRVGTRQGFGDVVSATIPVGPGNAGTHTSYTLNRPLSKDTYFWSIQTVDNQWQKSLFLSDASFTIKLFVNSTQKLLDLQQSSMAWGDYNSDGYPDVLIAGEDLNGNTRCVLYENNRGILKENTSITGSLTRFKNGQMAWGDIDNDGDLDLAVVGASERNTPLSVFYKNIHVGGNVNSPREPRESRQSGRARTLVKDLSNTAVLQPLAFSSLNWGDYDNDGDLDLITIGVDERGKLRTILYRNANGMFSMVEDQNFIGFANGAVRFVDFDNDGDLDIALTGESEGNGSTNTGRIYLNDGKGVFTLDSRNTLPELYSSSMAWADYNNDGNSELALMGDSPNGERKFYFFKNNPAGTLTENPQISQVVSGLRGGSMMWGDYDNDGDMDLIISGNNASSKPTIAAYKNNNNTLEPDPYTVFTGNGIDFSSLNLVDYDRDGDMDFFTLGRKQDNLVSYAQVYDNIESINNKNYAPLSPTLREPVVSSSSVTLQWESGSDPEGNGTLNPGLTYRLRVGTKPGDDDIVSSIYTNGPGQFGFARRVTLRNLSSSIFYWSVQSVDAGYLSSDWSSEGQFIIDTVKPVVDTVKVTPPFSGIGKATIVVNFRENFSLDYSKQPTISVKIGDQETPVQQISFDGMTWIGEVTIPASYPSGKVTVKVDNVYDGHGNKIDPVTSAGSFMVDTERPRVITTIPPADEAGVSNSIIIKATLNEPLLVQSVSQVIMKLFKGSAELSGTVTYDDAKRQLSFTPSDRLTGDTGYQVRIAALITDRVGNTMNADYFWSFKTAETVTAIEGGELKNQSGTVVLYFSPRTLAKDQEVPIVTIDPGHLNVPAQVKFTGIAYSIGPEKESVSLEKPATLTLKYGPEVESAGIDATKLSIMWANTASPSDFDWNSPLGGTVDREKREIRTVIKKLGTFGLFEDSRPKTGTKSIAEINFSPRVFSPNGSGTLPTETGLSFRLGVPMNVNIYIYNTAGRFVRRLAENRSLGAGMQTIQWDGKDAAGKYCPSGLYIVKVEGEGITELKTVGILNK